MVLSRLSLVARKFSTSSARLSGLHGGTPGENLPFDITNRYKLAVIMGLYLASGFGTPFLILRHNLLKKSG